MIQTNPYGFMCTSQPSDDHKTFTITAGGEQRSLSDHTVLVSHKGEIKAITWKDLGTTMQLIRLTPNQVTKINKSNDLSDGFVRTVRSILGWYTGYDEQRNLSYSYIPKLTGSKLIERLNHIDFFCDRYDITVIDEKRGWFSIGSAISITEEERIQHILGQFFGLCAMYGKPTINKEILVGYKIQIPILRYEIVEHIEKIITLLRECHFVINTNHNTTQQVMEITTNDYDLLAYIRILYGEEMNASLIDKILDLQKEIFIQYGISAEQKNMRWKLYEVKR